MKRFTTLLLPVLFLMFVTSCADECEDVICPAGQTCDNGTCVGGSSDNEVVAGFLESDTEWTADKIYELDGRVVVKSGNTLTINPGTIIKGQAGTGTSASVLIVERGAMIDARGTATNPIIFTSVQDNIEIGQLKGSNLDETDNEKWGGLIVLGSAPSSTEDGDTEGQIEGIPASETYGVYGGSDPSDNSGFIEYVSIRHGGITIGDGNEINGLTLGGVGSGTSIHHVEVVANLDDGIEFFGGTVNVSDAVVVYQGDDGIDIDQNYSGTIDNVVVITGDGIGTDEALEIDGPEGSTYTTGQFTITNGSFINEGTEGSAGDFKSKAQGTVTNCSWDGFTSFIKIRASFSDTTLCNNSADAFANLISMPEKLTISNNEVVSSTATVADIATVYTGSCAACGCDAALENIVDSSIGGNLNTVASGPTQGANTAEFNGWSWASISGKL